MAFKKLLLEDHELTKRQLLDRTRSRDRMNRASRRAETLNRSRTSKALLELGRTEYPDQGQHASRPKTRGECQGGYRPCPFVSCRYHLALDVNRHGGVKINFPGLEVWDLTETCALDVADRDGASLDDIAVRMNLTRERVRQIEESALRKMGEEGSLRGLGQD